MNAKFITIEGSEGVGKSTNITFIQQLLEEHSIKFVMTREPGGTPFAEEIRELLLKKREEPVNYKAELLCMFAARAQHVESFIKPNLQKGHWVISDRFTDASFAYQGGGRGIDWQQIKEIERWTLSGFKPDHTFLLDLDPQIGLLRAAKRAELDRFESEKIEFFDRVRHGYLKRVQEDPVRFSLVDASVDLNQVQNQIRSQFEQKVLCD